MLGRVRVEGYAWKGEDAAASGLFVFLVVCLVSVILLYENSIFIVFIRDRGML